MDVFREREFCREITDRRCVLLVEVDNLDRGRGRDDADAVSMVGEDGLEAIMSTREREAAGE